MKNLLIKLFEVKSKLGKMSKDSNNPFFNSKYFDVNALLENVEPLLHEKNLLLLQPIEEGKVFTRIFDTETGESVSSGIDLPSLTDPQKLGSAITYYRRYTLQSLLGVQAEDDDANKAAGHTNGRTNSQATNGQAKDEPTEWLNLFTKEGQQTKTYWDIAKAFDEGKKLTLSGIRKKYKVSKKTAEELKENFHIV